MKKYETNRTPNNIRKPNIALRRAVALGATATALFAGGAAFRVVTHENSNDYKYNSSGRTYPNTPMGVATIPEGGGALDAVRQVDPKVADDAWKSPEAEQRLEDLEEFINDQAPGGINGDHILQAGQDVQVPAIGPGPHGPTVPKP